MFKTIMSSIKSFALRRAAAKATRMLWAAIERSAEREPNSEIQFVGSQGESICLARYDGLVWGIAPDQAVSIREARSLLASGFLAGQPKATRVISYERSI